MERLSICWNGKNHLGALCSECNNRNANGRGIHATLQCWQHPAEESWHKNSLNIMAYNGPSDGSTCDHWPYALVRRQVFVFDIGISILSTGWVLLCLFLLSCCCYTASCWVPRHQQELSAA